MKRIGFAAAVVTATFLSFSPAWADELPRAHQGSLLVLLFLGFCALIIVAQVVPLLILMVEALSGVARKAAGRKRMVLAPARQEKTE